LRWDTHKNNGKDMIGHNRSLKGSRNHFAKLDEEKVKQLRNLHSNFGWKISQLSQKYQLHPRHVKGIIKRKFWKHVT
jgi:AraC-like DNA-binding protein